MELEAAHAAVVPLLDKRIGQLLGEPSLTRSRRPLEDEVLFDPKPVQDRFQLGLFEEAALVDDVLEGVVGWRWWWSISGS